MTNTTYVVHGSAMGAKGSLGTSRPKCLRVLTPPTWEAHSTVLSCGMIHPSTKQVTRWWLLLAEMGVFRISSA
jgi:hypothetical protein